MARTPRKVEGTAPAHFRFTPPGTTRAAAVPAVDAIAESIAIRLANGHPVSVWVADETADVTPREAADMLRVSRQLVMRMIADGDLPSHRLPNSTHHRLPVESVIALMRAREANRERVVAASRRLDEIGVDYE